MWYKNSEDILLELQRQECKPQSWVLTSLKWVHGHVGWESLFCPPLTTCISVLQSYQLNGQLRLRYTFLCFSGVNLCMDLMDHLKICTSWWGEDEQRFVGSIFIFRVPEVHEGNHAPLTDDQGPKDLKGAA